MRYVWLVEGEPYAGTLDDYAKDLEQAHLAGVDIGGWVWVADGPTTPSGYRQLKPITPDVTTNEYDDVRTVYITVGGDEARFKIDLRT